MGVNLICQVEPRFSQVEVVDGHNQDGTLKSVRSNAAKGGRTSTCPNRARSRPTHKELGDSMCPS